MKGSVSIYAALYGLGLFGIAAADGKLLLRNAHRRAVFGNTLWLAFPGSITFDILRLFIVPDDVIFSINTINALMNRDYIIFYVM